MRLMTSLGILIGMEIDFLDCKGKKEKKKCAKNTNCSGDEVHALPEWG
jgi:hypothetical protein